MLAGECAYIKKLIFMEIYLTRSDIAKTFAYCL